MKPPRPQALFLSPLAALAFAGCTLPTTFQSLPDDPEDMARSDAWTSGFQGPEPVLYARDGSPVSQPTEGPVTAGADRLGGAVEPEGGSRLYLLELYQRAVDERDELEFELAAQSVALAKTEEATRALEARFAELELRMNETRGANEGLEQQNLDLARRLTTAQIRRLEAEKLLLETTLRWEQVNEMRPPAEDESRAPAAEPRENRR